MKTKIIILTILVTLSQYTFSQNYPTFGPEIKVTITGLTFDAMEPFISLDGNTLFFNSLNSGGNTNLYYATKIDDTTYTYEGLVNGTYNPSPNHLDAVASIDSLNNFFWVSTRDYPTIFENLHRGIYSSGNVTNITRVYGDFNIYIFNYPYGWLIMDGTISYDGDYLYYNNAYFDFINDSCGIGIPCKAKIGVAQRVNDSTYNKLSNTDALFFNVNDTNYLVYAPQVTKDGLELYYTRLLKGTFNTEICVSVRSNIIDTFSVPMVIYSNIGFVPEAASPTTDKQKIYYHQKDGTGIFHIYLRYRTGTTGINEQTSTENIKVYPNPTNSIFNIVFPNPTENYTITVYSTIGQELLKTSNNTSIDISTFANGIYFLTVKQNDRNWTTKIVKE